MNLSEEHQSQIVDWLLGGIPYRQAREMIKTEFGIKTSFAALSSFWDQVCTPALLARRRRAVSTADEMAADAQTMPGKFDEATLDAIRQAAFNLAIKPQSNPGDVKKLFTLLLKAKDQELKNKDIEIKLRRLELVEKQVTKARGALNDSALNSSQREQRMKEIFGL